MVLQVALVASGGRFLAAEGGGGGGIAASSHGLGAWEAFRLFNRSRPGHEPRHGDSVVLQAWNGRFVSAAGGGGGAVNAALGWIEASTTFTIERVAGADTIRSGEQVALRAANGNFVVAEGGGGGAVNANRTHRGAWETFTIRIFRPQLIRLRSSGSRFVTAEGGGGAQVTANRVAVGLWETFSLLNLSRSDRTIRSGDTVALQVWNGKFIQVGGAVPTEVNANANRAFQAAQFTIRASGVDEIGHGRRINLQSRFTSQFLTARAGLVAADRSSAVDEALFTMEFAERAGIEFRWLPNGAGLPGRPLATAPTPISGEKRLLIWYCHNNLALPITASTEEVRSAVFGGAPSLASWLETMSAGRFRVTDSGVYGSVRIPDRPASDPDPGMSAILTAAEDAGVPLESYSDPVPPGPPASVRRVFRTDLYQLVEVSTWPGLGGQANRPRAGTSRRGVDFAGRVPWVGVTRDVDERSRMVLCHEISHAFLDVPDKYHLPFPVRGDVVATSETVGSRETFVIERVVGTGSIRTGEQVMLRADDTQHFAVSADPRNFVNVEGAAAGIARVFTIAALAATGTGEIPNGARVTFRSNAGRYMTAEGGGGSVLTANRTAVGSWEPFEIRKVSGSGTLQSGDRVSLRSQAGLFVVAEPGARDRVETLPAHERSAMYRWRETFAGQGAGFDNATDSYRAVMLSLFDRIRYGWVTPKYLTPENRGCYLLRPFLEAREALILFDPHNPGEWYTVENRKHVEDIDEVPSSGIVVSWICEDQGYWEWWFRRRGDTHAFDRRARYPVVISAMASHVPPNPLAAPIVLAHEWLYKRNHPAAAFRDQELVLPLGNGDPSRFHLSFHEAGEDRIAICIR